jgi:hypothetical protein
MKQVPVTNVAAYGTGLPEGLIVNSRAHVQYNFYHTLRADTVINVDVPLYLYGMSSAVHSTATIVRAAADRAVAFAKDVSRDDTSKWTRPRCRASYVTPRSHNTTVCIHRRPALNTLVCVCVCVCVCV